MSALYAPASVRDRFLLALDTGDRQTSTDMAANLTACSNPLPGMTCKQLGLPLGSTYGAAALSVLGVNPVKLEIGPLFARATASMSAE